MIFVCILANSLFCDLSKFSISFTDLAKNKIDRRNLLNHHFFLFWCASFNRLLEEILLFFIANKLLLLFFVKTLLLKIILSEARLYANESFLLSLLGSSSILFFMLKLSSSFNF